MLYTDDTLGIHWTVLPILRKTVGWEDWGILFLIIQVVLPCGTWDFDGRLN